MKIKQTIALSILAIAGLTACEKNLYEPIQEEPTTKVEDLNIADNFDWKMSTGAICEITTAKSVNLSIYQDEACKILLATSSVIPDKPLKLPLSILKSTQKLYIQIEGSTKVYAASVNTDGKINFVVPNVETRVAARAKDDFEIRGTNILYPNGGFGTVMFEDNYPNIGDYDFNDFVATYLVDIETYEGSTSIKTIKFDMKVQAIGATGYYGFIPHLRINLPFSSVSSMNVNNEKGVTDVKLLSDSKGNGDGKIVLAFYGAEDRKGEEFLNTEEGSLYIPGNKFDVTLSFEKGVAGIGFIYSDMFDIFLANKAHTKEIHMLGYGPAFTDNAQDYGNANYYKQDKTNLVWGINIPSIIGHAYEKTDFIKAYPQFAEWAQGGYEGIENEWYKKGIPNYIFPSK